MAPFFDKNTLYYEICQSIGSEALQAPSPRLDASTSALKRTPSSIHHWKDLSLYQITNAPYSKQKWKHRHR